MVEPGHRVDQDMPFATFVLLARVVARRIEPRPPFLGTLCASRLDGIRVGPFRKQGHQNDFDIEQERPTIYVV
jgi:hypothetical protein